MAIVFAAVGGPGQIERVGEHGGLDDQHKMQSILRCRVWLQGLL